MACHTFSFTYAANTLRLAYIFQNGTKLVDTELLPLSITIELSSTGIHGKKKGGLVTSGALRISKYISISRNMLSVPPKSYLSQTAASGTFSLIDFKLPLCNLEDLKEELTALRMRKHFSPSYVTFLVWSTNKKQSSVGRIAVAWATLKINLVCNPDSMVLEWRGELKDFPNPNG